jgi:hypothetical protein
MAEKKAKSPADRRKAVRRKGLEDTIRLVRKGDQRLDHRRKAERRKV